MVAVNGSPTSAEAVRFAIEVASGHNTELVFVHVVPTLDTSSFDEDTVIAIAHEPTDEDRAILRDAAEAAHASGLATKTVLLRGPTADEIVAAADFHDVDLIVVGSRRHSAIASALLGDVSLRVLRKSSRPVLVVRKHSARHSKAAALSVSQL